jgi:hypothetical protein
MMELPDNLDALLTELRAPKHDGQVKCERLTDDDLAFVQRILDSLKTGSKGVFAVIHPDNNMQYITLNAKGLASLVLVGKVMARITERLNDEA